MRIAVIGLGASGVATLVHLLPKLPPGTEVLLFEKDMPGPGLAYSVKTDSMILNMQAKTMGVPYAAHFIEWMQEQSLPPDPYPPRALYGTYLESILWQACCDATARGVTIDVYDIATSVSGAYIVQGKNTAHQVDRVILCLGNFPPTTFQHLEGTRNYFNSPWPEHKLSLIKSDAHVCVLGSRLTAIDIAIFLKEQGHTGKITFYSRSGLLPLVQATKPFPYDGSALKAELLEARSLVQSGRILKHYTDLVGGCDLTRTDSTVKLLREDINKAEKAIPWQAVLFSTSDYIEDLYAILAFEEKERFLDQFYSTWSTFRHAMPMQNAKKILALLEDCQ